MRLNKVFAVRFLPENVISLALINTQCRQCVINEITEHNHSAKTPAGYNSSVLFVIYRCKEES